MCIKLLYTITMFNRVHRFIKNITFNSGLNREKFINRDKFINNKKFLSINRIINKNKNMIIRKMTTQAQPSGNDDDNNNNNNNNNTGYMFVMALGVYISHNFDKNRKN